MTHPWLDWHAGWYWQTDVSHRVIALRPGADLPPWLAVDWDALSALINGGLALWQLWQAPDATTRLRYQLDQRQGWSDTLVMPWPDGIAAWRPADGVCDARCGLRAHVRVDEQGAFQGFHGILVPQCGAWAGQALLTSQDDGATEALQLRLAEQEALRYALSHDLRAPLRVIDGFARIVKEDYAAALGKLGSDHLDRVLAAAARMNGMIDAVLAQAQLSGESLSRSEIDLSALARDVITDLLAVRPSDAPVVQVVVADGMKATADEPLLRRVFENLLGNAMKYSSKVNAPKVEVGCMPATNPAVYYVRDNGAGFDMQHADKLFGMFQRLHSAREFPGSGVGLAGVQAIVRRHGGRIWAEAAPGEGACFYFTLMDSRGAAGPR